jgi:hypothetical protein
MKQEHKGKKNNRMALYVFQTFQQLGEAIYQTSF